MENLKVKKISQIADNIHLLMSQLLDETQAIEKNSKRLRLKIRKGLSELSAGLSESERREVTKRIAENVQQNFDETQSTARIKVDASKGCIGNEGGGVAVSNGSFHVKACVMGTPRGGITGGGIEVGWTY